jgi:N-acetylneuraminic acid mutarotase
LALPHKVAIKLKALYLDKVKTDREIPALYFHAHKRDYFFDEDRMGFQMELKVWRLLSVPTMKYYVHSWLGGKALLRAIYRLEDRAPQWCGRVGEYPMFFFKKEEKAAAPKAEQVAAHGVI